jgi:hypothetical protein
MTKDEFQNALRNLAKNAIQDGLSVNDVIEALVEDTATLIKAAITFNPSNNPPKSSQP